MKIKCHLLFFLSLILFTSSIFPQISSLKKIYMDIAHGQKFWNDPSDMKGQDENWVNRVKYMTDQFLLFNDIIIHDRLERSK
jgi:hypothetical protein